MQFTDFSTGSPATGSSSNHFQLQYCKTPTKTRCGRAKHARSCGTLTSLPCVPPAGTRPLVCPRRIVRAQCVKQSTMLYLPPANQRSTTLMISSGSPCSRYARPLARPRVRPPARLPAHSDACTHARTHAGDWRRRAQGDQKRGQAGVELACEREGACMCRYPALVPGRHRCPTVRALPCPLAVCPLAACPLAACARAACPLAACPLTACARAACPLAACPLAACPLAACPPARCLAG